MQKIPNLEHGEILFIFYCFYFFEIRIFFESENLVVTKITDLRKMCLKKLNITNIERNIFT